MSKERLQFFLSTVHARKSTSGLSRETCRGIAFRTSLKMNSAGIGRFDPITHKATITSTVGGLPLAGAMLFVSVLLVLLPVIRSARARRRATTGPTLAE